jgi:hypothetical protein
MARQTSAVSRGSSWRELAVAGGAAAAAILLLLIGVLLVWMLGRAPANVPVIGAGEPPTPTPRAISLARATTEAAAAENEDSENEAADPAPTEPSPEEVAPAPTVEALTIAIEPTAEVSPDEPFFAAPDDEGFDTIASGAWTGDADTLANDGTVAVAEPWLTIASVPSATFAVEAEIRVTDVLDSVCDQSFGLAAGNPAGGQMFGGGVLFPCAQGPNRARITDVAVWEDGYNADAALAEEAFDPGDDWRVYRFEVSGDRLRLIVDGENLLRASAPAPLDPAAAGEAGIWTQGVGVEVRRIVVYPLPD